MNAKFLVKAVSLTEHGTMWWAGDHYSHDRSLAEPVDKADADYLGRDVEYWRGEVEQWIDGSEFVCR